MGGLLAADIALVFRHRILGVVNFDVPFLGMHPGIVKAGLGSLFSPAPPPQDTVVPEAVVETSKKPSRMSTLFNPKPSDPNYNPAFPNDVQLPMRKGWDNTLHWLTKHYNDGLRQATKGLVKSHFEFGGAMADYRELKERYAKVRALEEEDDTKRSEPYPTMRSVPRIRFVNYYTASTGRPKKPKSPQSPRSPSPSRRDSLPKHDSSLHNSSMEAPVTAHPSSSQVSDSDSVASSEDDMTHVHPDPIADSPRGSGDADRPCTDVGSSSSTTHVVAIPNKADPDGAPNLPEIPPIPTEPPFVDLAQLTDKTARKAAEKEHAVALKEYQKAVKSRNKVINERAKLEEKWEKQREQGRAEREQKQAEAAMRQAEARQRQAEADQRQKEAESRMTDAERKAATADRQTSSTIAGANSRLEEDLGAVDLGAPDTAKRSSQSPSAHYDFSRSAIMNQAPPDDRASLTDSGHTLTTTNSHTSPLTTTRTDSDALGKPKKFKKFCMLPPKDAQGNKDPTWIRVFMEGVDEVTAHTTLFFVNQTYERLVGDVGARIEDWIREADSVRLVREISGIT